MKRKVFSLMMLCLFAVLGLANAQVNPRDGGLTLTPDPLEMGYRPNGAWMRPFEAVLSTTGTAETVTSIETSNEDFFVIDAKLPTVVEATKPMKFTIDNNDAPAGPYSAELVVWSNSRKAYIFNVSATAYDPIEADVWETAPTASSSFTATFGADIYDNYLLPGDEPDGKDVVYKLQVENDVLFTATVEGANGKTALYAPDFNGQPGPGANNSIGSEGGAAAAPYEAHLGEEGTLTTANFPFMLLYNYCVAENLFLADELAEAGMTTAPMASISWNASSVQNFEEKNITIWMANVDDEVLTSTTHNTSGMTKVFTGNITPEVGWNEFVFNEGSFAWDGVSNLLVCVQRNNGTWHSNMNWRSVSTDFVSQIYQRNDNNPYDMENNTYPAYSTEKKRAIAIFKSEGSKGRTVAMGIDGMTLTPGEYYLVASSTSDEFTLNVNMGTIPTPEPVANPYPADGDDDISMPLTFTWELGQYTTEYRMLLGTSYPPTDVVVDWTSNLAESLTVNNLYNNTIYWWRIDERNSSGEVTGPVWGFTTSFNIPQNLTATPQRLYMGETLTLTWDQINDRSYRGYNVYQDGVKINDELLTANTFDVAGLAYNMEGYTFNVTAVYDEGESHFSNDVLVTVTGNGTVSGKVSEQDGTTGIGGATVVFTGVDEYNTPATFTFTTAANGTYSGDILAGVYETMCWAEGYQPVEGEGTVTIVYNTNTPNVNFSLDENWNPVGEVIAEEVDENLVKVYWSQNIMSEIIEDFETGDLSSFDWQNDATYPWTLTTNNPYEGSYCLKSGNSGVASSTSSIQVTVEISRNGLMSFYGKPSCENNYDKGYFYIDNVEKAAFTGAGSWAQKEFPIASGTHTFKWAYTKDSSVDSNDDCFYIDYISFVHDAAPAETGWITYEDGVNSDAIGLTDGGSFYWGICFPAEMMAQYGSFTMTKVKLYDYSAHTGKVMIYKGGTTAPGTLVTEQNYTCTGSSNYVEVTLSNPVSIDPSQSIWVVLNNFDGQYVAAGCVNTGDPNGRWISLDGSDWMDLLEAASTLNYTWQIQAYVTDGSKSAPLRKDVAAAPVYTPNNLRFGSISELQGDPNWTPSANRSFQHYNIYRTSCYDMTGEDAEFLGSTNDTIYLEEHWADMDPGVYKWGVSRFYEGNRGRNRVTYDFEGSDLQGWTSIDNDGDGNGWENWNSDGTVAHSGTGVATSESYINYVGALTPDNWLVSPQVELGGTMTFWAAGQDPSYAAEHFAVYVSTSGTAVANFTQVLPETVATGTMTQYSVDLSSYSGNGYVAIRHYNVTDMFRLNIDDITFGDGGDDPNPPTPPTPPNPNTPMTYTGVHGESGVVWSNCLENKMYVSSTINVTTNSGDEVTGTTVTLYNTSEPDMNLTYNVTLDETGTYTWESMRRGTYELNINLEGFEPIAETVEITDGTVLNYRLVEVLDATGGLYVSGTGWAIFGEMPAPTPVDPVDPTPGEGQWYYYDNGEYGTSIGLGGGQFSWAVMFPAGSYTGNLLTKVKVFDSGYPMTGDVTIYSGGSNEPGTAVGTMDVTFTGANEYLELEFPNPVVIDPTQNVWVVFYNASGATYPAAGSPEVISDPNARWVYIDGYGWLDCADAGVPGYSWMIRAFIANGAKGEMEEVSVNHTYNMGGTLAKVDGPRSFEYYNVKLDDVLEGTTTMPFFQHNVENLVEGETYTTSVQKVYTSGESEWESFDWVYTPCDNFEGLQSASAEWSGDNVVLNWVLPEGGDLPDDPDDPDPEPGETITADFEDGTLGDWTSIDADGDGNEWYALNVSTIPGHNNSVGLATSASYSSAALNPDNYLVSPAIVLGGTLHFYACAQDAAWASEHFGVAVSTTNNTSASAFTTIQEWDMQAKSNGAPTEVTRSGNRAQGTWYEYTVDLSSYSGTGYVAIRHFNCTDWFRLNVDDITYTAPAKRNRSTSYDFEGGVQGWTTLDADANTSMNWYHSSNSISNSGYDYTGFGHGGSNGFMVSQSFIDYDGAYQADNYLVSPQMFALQNGSNITFWADNANDSYPDSFGVYVATVANPTPSDFTMVWDGNAKGANSEKAAVRHSETRYNNWRQHTVDLSAYAGQTVWIAFRHHDYDMYEIWIDDVTINAEGGDTPPDDPDDPTPGANIIGVEIFRDGEWIAEVQSPAQTFTDIAPGEVEYYEIRVVYNGNTEDYTYYTMSCPEIVVPAEVECIAPENLEGDYLWVTENYFGALINWTYPEEVSADWYQYDDNTYATSVGAGGAFQWAVMFPGGTYEGNTVVKVGTMDYLSNASVMHGSVSIWSGGTAAPQTQLASMDITFTGTMEEVEYTFDEPVVVDPLQNLWVVFSNDDCSGYPAAAGSDTGDPNGRWIGIDGGWYDLAAAGLPGYNWIIHCYISEGLSFNVYRNDEVIATVPYSGETMTYFDQAPIGNYRYQVTAVSDECESDFAMTPDESANYVDIFVTDVTEGSSVTKLYPNPTNGYVKIEASGMTHLTVVNALGQIVYDADINGDMYELNMGQYDAGLYMVRIASENGVSVKRVTLVK